MLTKADVQARVLAYMQDRGLSESEMARRIGISQPTLNRILADNAAYQGSAKGWRQLAQFKPLGFSEAEVLAAVGLGPSVTDGEADPWEAFQRALNRLPLSDRHRAHLEFQAEILLRDSRLAPNAVQQ